MTNKRKKKKNTKKFFIYRIDVKLKCRFPTVSCRQAVFQNLHPTSIRIMENIFSLSVLGATLPNPTEISPVKQKYRLVQYRLWKYHPIISFFLPNRFFPISSKNIFLSCFYFCLNILAYHEICFSFICPAGQVTNVDHISIVHDGLLYKVK